MRAQLLTALTSATSTLTNFSVSQELPWEQSGQPLYLKNMKKIYVDQEYREEATLIHVIGGNNIMSDQVITNVYVACDAKNTPSGLDNLVSNILSVKDSVELTAFEHESDYSVDKQEDVLVYTFKFRAGIIK